MNDELRAIAHRALAISHRPQMRHQRQGRLEIRDGVILYRGDIPGPIFNRAVTLGPTAAPERVFALAEEFFTGVAGGWGAKVEADAGHPMEAALWDRGWQRIEDVPAMVLPAIPEPPAPPGGLEIRRVTDRAGLDIFLAAHEDEAPAPQESNSEPAPGDADPKHFIPPNVNELLIPLACALDPDVALFVGFIDGVPVARSGLYCTDGIAEIGSVDVAPSRRRAGLGTAMTWAALAEGAIRGCTAGALCATKMGYPVYLRMGFLPVCTYRSYWNPAVRQ